jgi:hypothetical protein
MTRNPRLLHTVCVALSMALATFAIVVVGCLCPAGYQQRLHDSHGVYIQPRPHDFFRRSWFQHPSLIHISRASVPYGDDTVTITLLFQNKFKPITAPVIDPNPPIGPFERFVQAVRDRRTEFYAEMSWPDPNPEPK